MNLVVNWGLLAVALASLVGNYLMYLISQRSTKASEDSVDIAKKALEVADKNAKAAADAAEYSKRALKLSHKQHIENTIILIQAEYKDISRQANILFLFSSNLLRHIRESEAMA